MTETPKDGDDGQETDQRSFDIKRKQARRGKKDEKEEENMKHRKARARGERDGTCIR